MLLSFFQLQQHDHLGHLYRMYFSNYQIRKHSIRSNRNPPRQFEQFIYRMVFDLDHLYPFNMYLLHHHHHNLHPPIPIFNLYLLKLVLHAHQVLLVYVFPINDYVICILRVHNLVYLNHHFVLKVICSRKYLAIVK